MELMLTDSYTNALYNVLLIIALLSMVGAPLLYGWRKKNRKIRLPGTSVLLSYYTDGVSLATISKGMIGTLHYDVILGLTNTEKVGESSVIYQIILPYVSSVHLLGISKSNGITQLNPAGLNSLMEPVVLEGDYPRYFNLYAETGMQIESRYVLNPTAMQFTIDFLRSFSWEIIDNTLYVVVSGNAEKLLEIGDAVEKFVTKIAPAISLPMSDEHLRNLLPQGEEYRTDLKCPTCEALLKNEDDYLMCPNGDGLLLQGSALLKLHAGALKVPQQYLVHQGQSAPTINCPGCGSPMVSVAYQASKTIINTCTRCPYRWLDAADVAGIAKKADA